jgi:hypothetical protein
VEGEPAKGRPLRASGGILATSAPQQRGDTDPLIFAEWRRFCDKPSDVLFGSDVAALGYGCQYVWVIGFAMTFERSLTGSRME